MEMNVKYHSNQKTTDLFIAETVSKIISHKNVVVVLDLTEDRVMVEMTEALGLVRVQENADQENRILQLVVIVEMNVKYHLYQKKTDLFIAETAFKITNKINKLF